MFWFWILITMLCMAGALKGRFSARPFLTLIACLGGILANSYYLGFASPMYGDLPWLQASVVVVLAILQLGFGWMFFRSIDHLLEIQQKHQEIITDLQTELTTLKRQRPRYRLSD